MFAELKIYCIDENENISCDSSRDEDDCCEFKSKCCALSTKKSSIWHVNAPYLPTSLCINSTPG